MDEDVGAGVDPSERAQHAGACSDEGHVHDFVCDVGDEAQVDVAFTALVMALNLLAEIVHALLDPRVRMS